jgi:hypothetical protein
VVESNWKNFVEGEVFEFSTPRLIASKPNEIDAGPGPVIGPGASGSKSLFLNIAMQTENPNVSPVIDAKKVSLLALANVIDDPGLAEEFESVVKPIDLIMPGMKVATGTITAPASSLELPQNVTITGGSVSDWCEGCYILIDDLFLRRVTDVSLFPQITLEYGLSDAVSVAAIKTSRNNVFTFGDSLYTTTEVLAPVNFSISPYSISTTSADIVSLFSRFNVGDLIYINDPAPITSLNHDKYMRIERVVVDGNNSATLYIDPSSVVTSAGIASVLQAELGVTVTITAVADSIKCTDANISREILKNIKIGSFVEVVGSEKDNNGTFKVLSFSENAGLVTIFVAYDVSRELNANVSLTMIEDFLDQISPLNGTAAAKYVSRRMVLQNPSSAVRVNLLASVPEDADFELFVKYMRSDQTGIVFDELPYFKLYPDNPYISSPIDGSVFSEVSYTFEPLPAFNAIAVKLVMYSGSSTAVPKFKDLALIALDY